MDATVKIGADVRADDVETAVYVRHPREGERLRRRQKDMKEWAAKMSETCGGQTAEEGEPPARAIDLVEATAGSQCAHVRPRITARSVLEGIRNPQAAEEAKRQGNQIEGTSKATRCAMLDGIEEYAGRMRREAGLLCWWSLGEKRTNRRKMLQTRARQRIERKRKYC